MANQSGNDLLTKEISLPRILFYVLLAVAIVVNASGLFIDILEPDSALYASIAKRIALTNDWVNLYGDGHDWLDKPHFPFWVAAISFKVFGINAFGYKLPSFIFWLIGIRYTYLLTKNIYNDSVARLAVIIYITALHGVLENFDVRAEGYLTALIIAAIYYILRAGEKGRLLYYLLAAFCSACAIMTKGIFVLFTIWGGFALYWLVTYQWKQFVDYRIWLTVLLTLVFTFPELCSLYVQFDMHPEKIDFGQTHVSGIRFFFWDSQFGRFFNTGPIRGEGDPFFFLHTLLWAFLPWPVILYTAVIRLFARKGNGDPSNRIFIVYGSAAITFVLFSLSKFQLPHYIIIIFPQLAIITAQGLMSFFSSKKLAKGVSITQSILLIITVVASIALMFITGFNGFYSVVIFASVIGCFIFYKYRKTTLRDIVLKGFASFAMLHLFLNVVFYPQLLQFQSGMLAGKWLTEHGYNKKLAMYKSNSYSLEFYAPVNVDRLPTGQSLDSCIAKGNIILYTTKENAAELTGSGYNVQLLKEYAFYPVSRLTLPFLNYKTRSRELQQIVLANVSKK
ncbi:glycosyltransferase family 39 protein [Danxiaibacter flavus]|uniref:Glycosyltransferase family 39 protein n=1 Tax=Danxiaibacter flavus TaxID=3049108 RepID=A0ABV3ZNF8_9BACT|nr:glycosyltransferase family 39 protein [Chitinophagaceae bacterium DXS]